jgi:hypothetical protein
VGDGNAMSSERGAVLSFVLMVVGVLSVLGMAMASLVRVDTMQQNAQESVTRNFLAAEAGINQGIGEFRNLFLGFNIPEGPDFDARFLAIDGHNVRYRLQGIPTTPPPFEQVTLPAGDAFAGLNSIRYRYSAQSDDLHPDGNAKAGLRAQFEVNYVPIFQFLFFYAGDLEFDYPAAMNLHGRIHSNGDLYLNAGSPVSVGDAEDVPIVQVSAGRNIYRGESAGGAGCTGTFTIDTLADTDGDGSLDPRVLPCTGGTTAVTPAVAAAWAGSLLPRLGDIQTPEMSEIERGSGEYWEKADLRIVLNLEASPDKLHASCEAPSVPVEVQNEDGSRNVALTAELRDFMWTNPGKIFFNDVPTACTTRSSACALLPNSYTPAFADAQFVYLRATDDGFDAKWHKEANKCAYRRGGFFNNREKAGTLAGGKWIQSLNVDVQALLDWNREEGNPLFDADDRTDGGVVIFLSVVGPASKKVNHYGVRVFDSPDLGFPIGEKDPTGLTVVSDQAIYVEGNYNTVDKAPAAILGDTINVLSQGWGRTAGACPNDCRSAMDLGQRPPAATTMNAAFLGGTDVMLPTARNGGVNNYPRLHENWTGVSLGYRGSMVSLGTPRHQEGRFCGAGSVGGGCNIYSAPVRNWDYDPDFNEAANLPPLTPRVVWVQQALFTQEFR